MSETVCVICSDLGIGGLLCHRCYITSAVGASVVQFKYLSKGLLQDHFLILRLYIFCLFLWNGLVQVCHTSYTVASTHKYQRETYVKNITSTCVQHLQQYTSCNSRLFSLSTKLSIIFLIDWLIAWYLKCQTIWKMTITFSQSPRSNLKCLVLSWQTVHNPKIISLLS